MADIKDYTPEEIQEMIEKAKRDWQETLDKMTPEERAEAQRKAQQALEEDEIKMQKLLDDCAKILSHDDSSKKPRPKFCSNCGAPAGNGNFCEFCGTQF